MNSLLLVFMLLSISGCAQFQAAETVLGAGIAKYCNVEPQARAVIRNRVAMAVAPNSIEVKCAADSIGQ